jgi:hypothetical protein
VGVAGGDACRLLGRNAVDLGLDMTASPTGNTPPVRLGVARALLHLEGVTGSSAAAEDVK